MSETTERTTSPSRRGAWLGRLFDDRGLRLATGLAVVVAIPVAVLFYFQFRSINDLASTSSVVLRQLSHRHGPGRARAIAARQRSIEAQRHAIGAAEAERGAIAYIRRP